MKNLALFDLDNTLINGDSDALWHCFLHDRGIISSTELDREENKRFHQDYMDGKLDMNEYIKFVARVLNSIKPCDYDIKAIRKEFVTSVIKPIVLPAATNLIEQHKSKGDYTIIISATNSLTVKSVAELFDIDLWMGTDIEIVDGSYTGKIIGNPCFQDGKIEKIKSWLKNNPDYSLERSSFYSDSINDLPLLSEVSNPVAVDPDNKLYTHAKRLGWPVISLQKGDNQEAIV